MIDEALKQYLESHTIQKIGKTECIVDNPLEYLDIISKSGYYISKILWWEHIEIENQKNAIGVGGPIDSRDKHFFYSETFLSRNFSESDGELCRAYLLEVPRMYQDHHLIPSFFLGERVKNR